MKILKSASVGGILFLLLGGQPSVVRTGAVLTDGADSVSIIDAASRLRSWLKQVRLRNSFPLRFFYSFAL
ncbi:MAG: hypothetical protein IH591_15145 [Bacteroidales bacterium]|nr:hypothetical protein [Bacteroidales bacterium]